MERYGAIESVLRAEIVELEQALDAAHKRIGDLDYELHHKWESDTFCDEKVGGKIGYVPYIPLAKRLEQQLADAQATVEALQAQLESANTLLHKKNCAIGKAETTIEALQAVIRQMGEQAAVLAKDGMAAKAQIDKTNLENAYANNETRNILCSGIQDRDVKISTLRQQVETLQQSRTCVETYLSLIAALLTVQSTHTTLTSGWCEDVCNAVKALQRERDEWERKCRELCQAHGVLLIEHYDVKKALDAERGKVENLEHKIQARGGLALIDDARAKAGLYDQLATQLSQLQALVRAWGTAHESVDDWFRRAATDENTPTISEFEAVKKVLFDSERALKATLDATTPAPETSIIGKCVPPSQYDPNAQVRGDIS